MAFAFRYTLINQIVQRTIRTEIFYLVQVDLGTVDRPVFYVFVGITSVIDKNLVKLYNMVKTIKLHTDELILENLGLVIKFFKFVPVDSCK